MICHKFHASTIMLSNSSLLISKSISLCWSYLADFTVDLTLDPRRSSFDPRRPDSRASPSALSLPSLEGEDPWHPAHSQNSSTMISTAAMSGTVIYVTSSLESDIMGSAHHHTATGVKAGRYWQPSQPLGDKQRQLVQIFEKETSD